MRLVSINGKLWELSCLQNAYSKNGRDIPDEEANKRILLGLDISDVTRVLANHGVRSLATATIETDVRGLPHQMVYEIYLNSKGFFCKVQGQRVFLNQLPWRAETDSRIGEVVK